ncbi:MAG: hypothetical protein JNL51_12275 [Chitinophagaceae bacterium]|nr:hypothetical protein [Chitinophagaceae bacterium]
MTLLFTPEELVQYLYNETSPERTAEIKAALQHDWALREKLEAVRDSVHLLNNEKLESPRTEVVTNILRYARESLSEPVQPH